MRLLFLLGFSLALGVIVGAAVETVAALPVILEEAAVIGRDGAL
jgi:hypothetical protein